MHSADAVLLLVVDTVANRTAALISELPIEANVIPLTRKGIA